MLGRTDSWRESARGLAESLSSGGAAVDLWPQFRLKQTIAACSPPSAT